MRLDAARNLRHALHWPVLIPAALLLMLGLLFLSGLEVRAGGPLVTNWHMRQLKAIAIGLAAATVLQFIPYKSLVKRGYLLYAFNLGLLALVLVAGPRLNHSRRWINLAGFSFQPSELMKVTLVLTLAQFIRFRSSYKTFKGLGAPFLLTLGPMALILVQPDLGTALLCIPLLFTMLFLAGARARHLGLIVVTGAACIFPVYKWGLQDYQRGRIDGFLTQLSIVNAKEDEALRQLDRDQNYQLDHSKVAIGSGGLMGAGLGRGEEAALFWVPERHNDFIFAVVGNEWGLMGGFCVLALFAWLLTAILALAARHRDPAGRLICIGVFALLGFQTLINIAMTVGLMPITGMTLPFLSYGGSSVMVSILSVGLVCNVAARPSYEFGRGDFD